MPACRMVGRFFVKASMMVRMASLAMGISSGMRSASPRITSPSSVTPIENSDGAYVRNACSIKSMTLVTNGPSSGRTLSKPDNRDFRMLIPDSEILEKLLLNPDSRDFTTVAAAAANCGAAPDIFPRIPAIAGPIPAASLDSISVTLAPNPAASSYFAVSSAPRSVPLSWSDAPLSSVFNSSMPAKVPDAFFASLVTVCIFLVAAVAWA